MKAEGFGYKNAWVAFRMDDPARVVEVLALRDLRPADWAAGIAAAHEYPIGCSVFVTPPIDGWVCCVGYPLFAAVDARPPTFAVQAAGWAAQLGCEVQYFSTHRVVESHAWARARPDGLVRAYAYVGESGEKVLDEGDATLEERELGFAFFDPTCAAAESDDYWDRDDLDYPREDHVMALAGRWSLDPSALDDRDIEVGEGVVGQYGDPPPPPQPRPEPAPQEKPWWKVW